MKKIIILIDNNRRKPVQKTHRWHGFKSVVRSFNRSSPDKIILKVIRYNKVRDPKYREVIAASSGAMLTGSSFKLSDFYHSGKKRNLLDDEKDFILTYDKPLLGICFGHELIGIAFGFKIGKCEPEEGHLELKFHEPFSLFPNRKNINVEMVHKRQIIYNPRFELFFDIFSSNDNCKVQVIKHKDRPIYGVQFHPETTHFMAQKDGHDLLHNFFGVVINSS